MKVLVLLGGDSPEREVSLRSGKAITKALLSLGHEVDQYDPINGFGNLKKFAGKVDCVFPIMHGREGEDGKVQKHLENLGFKYLGSDSKVSKLCFDKVAFKKSIEKLKIPTPKWEVVDSDSFFESPLSKKAYVLKPIEGGSTIDAFIIRNLERESHDHKIFDKYPEMLLEELIEVTEITVPILGNKALPVIEIIPPAGEEFDYDNKYNGKTQELCPPKNVSIKLQKQAQQLAEQIHAHVGARHLSRTDMMVDAKGELFVLEINTMPGMTATSLFPKSAKQAGLSFRQLTQRLLGLTTQ